MTTDRTISSPIRSGLAVVVSASLLAAGAMLCPAGLPSANAGTVPTAVSGDQRSEPDGHRVVHHDARRDVLLFTEEADTSEPAPRDRATDITTTVVDHGSDRLRVRSRVRDLRRSEYRLMVAEILTSSGRRYELLVDYSTTPIDSRVGLSRFGSGARVRCTGATWSVDRRLDRIDASVPSSCLGDPEWVRVGLAVVAAPYDLRTSWADDSRADGRIGDRHLELGPRQPRPDERP